jgi:hypothetical protein
MVWLPYEWPSLDVTPLIQSEVRIRRGAQMMLLLGYDVGSSSVKAMLMDAGMDKVYANGKLSAHGRMWLLVPVTRTGEELCSCVNHPSKGRHGRSALDVGRGFSQRLPRGHRLASGPRQSGVMKTGTLDWVKVVGCLTLVLLFLLTLRECLPTTAVCPNGQTSYGGPQPHGPFIQASLPFKEVEARAVIALLSVLGFLDLMEFFAERVVCTIERMRRLARRVKKQSGKQGKKPPVRRS